MPSINDVIDVYEAMLVKAKQAGKNTPGARAAWAREATVAFLTKEHPAPIPRPVGPTRGELAQLRDLGPYEEVDPLDHIDPYGDTP